MMFIMEFGSPNMFMGEGISEVPVSLEAEFRIVERAEEGLGLPKKGVFSWKDSASREGW